jgi:hypothetical protein
MPIERAARAGLRGSAQAAECGAAQGVRRVAEHRSARTRARARLSRARAGVDAALEGAGW